MIIRPWEVYWIHNKLGNGAFGSVSRATHMRSGAAAAVTIMTTTTTMLTLRNCVFVYVMLVCNQSMVDVHLRGRICRGPTCA